MTFSAGGGFKSYKYQPNLVEDVGDRIWGYRWIWWYTFIVTVCWYDMIWYQTCCGGIVFLMLGRYESASKCLKWSPVSVGNIRGKIRQVPVSVMTTTGRNLGLGGDDWIASKTLFWNWVEEKHLLGTFNNFCGIPYASWWQGTSYEVDTIQQLGTKEAAFKWWKMILISILSVSKHWFKGGESA